MADKKVTVKVVGESDLAGVEPLENKVNALKNTKLLMQIETDTAKLNEVNSRIESIQSELTQLKGSADVDDSKVKELEGELESLKQESINLQVKVATNELKAAKDLEESLNDTATLQLKVEGMESIKEGLSSAKQGAQDLFDNVMQVQQAGMQSEQNKAFLGLNEAKLNGQSAAQVYQQISDIVARMPGDDNTMRSVLSTAQALGNNLSTGEMENATKTMADYMAGSATMGKQAVESQQDIMKYLLDGNTAELERGSIVSSHVDKLKEATTFQERQAAMQEVLNELGYGGISQTDTMLNKQAEWEGMMYNSKDALSSMWLTAEKGAMDYILKLNEGTGGILGMGIAAAQMAAGPLVDLFGGIGQVGMGLKSLKDLGIIQWFRDLELVSKLSAAADWLLSGAQAVLNAVMSMNPIVLVVLALIALAAALVWAYYNVDWFRQMVDNAWQSLIQIGQTIYGYVMGAIQWLSDLFMSFTSQLGLNTNDWIQAVLGFILFIPTLPIQVGVALVNALARVFGFKGNFVQSLISAGANAVHGFVSYITQLPGIVMGEFNRVLGLVNDFINSIPQRVWEMGVAIIDALKHALGIGSPGHMFYMIEGEFKRIDDLTQKTRFDTGSIAQDMVDNFNPNFNRKASGGSANDGEVTQVLNFYFNDTVVDSDERMEKIYQFISRKLSFDNKTAGRTV